MSHRRRLLLPKDHPAAPPRLQSVPGPGTPQLAAKRRNTVLACNLCRRRKVRCDGKRPSCLLCAERGAECTYPLRQRIITLPAEGSQKADLPAIRESNTESPRPARNPSELSRYLDAMGTNLVDFERRTPYLPGPSTGLSNANFFRSCLPATRNSLEFELAVRHAVAYPVLHPYQITSLPVQGVLEPAWTKRHSDLASLHLQDSIAHGDRVHEERSPGLSEILAGTENSQAMPMLEPLPPVGVGLQRVNISDWTNVSISNEKAVRVLSLYLETDYQVLPIFHWNLFLEDMVHGRTRFCSRALVCSLMSWACQAYTALDPTVSALSAAFLEEATSLLSKSRGEGLETLPSVSALQFLCMTCVTQGRDDLALWYAREGVREGKALGLFDVYTPGDVMPEDETWMIASSYVAWGVFNWICLYGLHFQRIEIRPPPLLPMPGTLKTLDAHAQVFHACCGLWIIFNEVLLVYHGSGRPAWTVDQDSIRYAEDIFRRLLAWAHDLPLSLVRGQDDSHALVLMHIYYHAIIADVFRPFLRPEFSQPPLLLRTFEAPHASPLGVYSASMNQLKRLLIIYRTHFKTATLSVLWHTPIVYVANALMQDGERISQDQEWQYYLCLCLSGLEDLYVSYRVFGSVAKGLLGMALQHGLISKRHATRVARNLDLLKQLHTATDRLADGRMVTHWIVDLELAFKDPEGAQGTSLEGQFHRLMRTEETPQKEETL